MAKKDKLEVLLWSIALPGVGQLLNSKYVKGVLFLFFEFLINVKARLNMAIILSFQGQTQQAIMETDYQWLLFYPCVYMFAMWDAYRDAGGRDSPYSFLPFVFAAYVGTIGVVYSSVFHLSGVYIGPIFLPIISLCIGAALGILVRYILFQRA